MKVLVLGSSGFLGSYLGFALPKLGHQVAGVSRRNAPYFPGNQVVNGLEDISEMIRSGDYDVVINCVAVASHEACEEDPKNAEVVNATFPGVWASVASQGGSRFVHISTMQYSMEIPLSRTQKTMKKIQHLITEFPSLWVNPWFSQLTFRRS